MAALLGVIAAVAAIFLIVVFRGGSDYTVTAKFQTGSQFVGGNEVVVAGVRAGSIKKIDLSADNAALVTFSVDKQFAPLPKGTVAAARIPSVATVAGRQLDLRLPPRSKRAGTIPDHGEIPMEDTISMVDFDQFLAVSLGFGGFGGTLGTEGSLSEPGSIPSQKPGQRSRTAFNKTFQGLAGVFDKKAARRANVGLKYAEPLLATTGVVQDALLKDAPALEQLISSSSRVSGALAERAPQLASLVDSLNRTSGALARRKRELATSVHELPGLLREINTTSVNARSALDDLDPLVDATAPVVPKLRPLFARLRRVTAKSVPIVDDLNQIAGRRGAHNDALDLLRLSGPLVAAGVGTGAPTCGANPMTDYGQAADDNYTQGALGETTCALQNSLPLVAFGRAYSPETIGFLDTFAHPFVQNANGSIGRVALGGGPYSFSIPGFPSVFQTPLLPSQQFSLLTTGQRSRCPGSNERDPGDNSTPYTDNGTVPCDPTQVPPGP